MTCAYCSIIFVIINLDCIVGDFNAHSDSWFSVFVDVRGDLLVIRWTAVTSPSSTLTLLLASLQTALLLPTFLSLLLISFNISRGQYLKFSTALFPLLLLTQTISRFSSPSSTLYTNPTSTPSALSVRLPISVRPTGRNSLAT